jgi:hypothetical protein
MTSRTPDANARRPHRNGNEPFKDSCETLRAAPDGRSATAVNASGSHGADAAAAGGEAESAGADKGERGATRGAYGERMAGERGGAADADAAGAMKIDMLFVLLFGAKVHVNDDDFATADSGTGYFEFQWDRIKWHGPHSFSVALRLPTARPLESAHVHGSVTVLAARFTGL